MHLSHGISLLLAIFLMTNSAQAEDVTKPCFDFATKVVTPLKPAPAKFEKDKDESESKEGEDKNTASVSGLVQSPIFELYQRLLNPRTVRASEDVEIKTTTTESKDYLKRITQSIKISPVFFLTLKWNEEWVYALKDGTAEAPKTVVISFEKTEGTSHIKRLCGNIVLQKVTPATTGVFIYEEMKADRRDAKDLLNDISGTLRTLRGIPGPSPTPISEDSDS